MKQIIFFCSLMLLPFSLWAQVAPVAYSKDQAKLYLQMYQQFLTQTYLTEENLTDAYYLWAALGLYGPPTIKEEAEVR